MGHTFIIAEAGVNHNGDMELAHELIEAAANAGADAVKFQTYDCEKLDPPGERREMLRKYQLSRDDHILLKAHADCYGIEFMSTPFDVESLSFLVNKVGIKRIKIASGQHWLIEPSLEYEIPMIISQGMGECSPVGIGRGDILYVHCTSSYPCPDSDVNLSRMKYDDGLSDHSEGIIAPIAAVALGAKVIEKHLTLDRNMEGPDHKASIEPAQFKEMVTAIRRVEVMLGVGERRVMPSEEAAIKIAKEREAWRSMSS